MAEQRAPAARLEVNVGSGCEALVGEGLLHTGRQGTHGGESQGGCSPPEPTLLEENDRGSHRGAAHRDEKEAHPGPPPGDPEVHQKDARGSAQNTQDKSLGPLRGALAASAAHVAAAPAESAVGSSMPTATAKRTTSRADQERVIRYLAKLAK